MAKNNNKYVIELIDGTYYGGKTLFLFVKRVSDINDAEVFYNKKDAEKVNWRLHYGGVVIPYNPRK